MDGPQHDEARDTEVPGVARPGPPRPGGRLDRVGVALLVLAAVAVGLAGSVRPWQQSVVHLAAAALALVAATWDPARLARAGVASRLAAAAALGPALGLLSLAWLPRGVVGAVAPGIAQARASAWLPLTAAPEATAAEVARGTLGVTVVAVAATWAAGRSHAGRRLATAVGAGSVALAAFAALHALSGTSAVLGVLAVGTPRDPFFAPLVNPNHLGALLALGLPAALGAARDGGRFAALWWGGVVLLGAVLLALQSPGAWLAAAVAVGAWAFAEAGARGRAAVVLVAAAGAVALAFVGSGWVESSVGRRLSIWRDVPALAADHWLLGAGGGAFGEAFPAYRTSRDWEHVVHAHSEPLEALAEHGLVGVVAWVAVVVLVARAWRRSRVAPAHRSRVPGRVLAGLVGVGAQATWEFALQIPGVAVVVLAALAALIGASTVPRSIDPRRWRRALVALAVGQVLAAGWMARHAAADGAAATIATARAPDAATDRAASVLARTAPWRGERAVYAAWTALAAGDAPLARARAAEVVERHADDPDALRRAGLVLARAGDPSQAEAALRRAIARDPEDYRSWAALARLLAAEGRAAEALDAWPEAIARWPWQYAGADPIAEAWPLLPVGLWWIEALGDAPGFWSLELAEHLERQGDDAEAYLALEQAVRLRPAYVDSIARATLLHRLGRLDEAEVALRRMLLTRPREPSVGLHLGSVLSDAGRPDEAVAVYAETARRFPAFEPVRVAHVRAVAAKDGPEAAIAVASGHLLDGRARPRLALELARQEAAAGRPGDCLRTIAARVPDRDPTLAADRAALREACLQACPRCEDPE